MIPVIAVNALHKRFGRVSALSGIDLEVASGEIYGFIGPNGAGKTTTIRILLGVLKPSAGQARLFGRDAWTEAVPIHRKVAYVPGEIHLWPELTGGEVIDLLLRWRGSYSPRRREELVAKFELDPSRKCGTYSKGNRQKVLLVAAFAADAELLILDEPSSGLDPLMTKVFEDCVRAAKEEGKTVFLSSHILSEVERLCDRVSIIRQGKIIESGSLAELRHLTRTHIRTRTRKPLTGLDRLAGVHNATAENGSYSFWVDAEALSPVMQYLADHEVLALESAPPTLEDLFLRYYRQEAA